VWVATVVEADLFGTDTPRSAQDDSDHHLRHTLPSETQSTLRTVSSSSWTTTTDKSDAFSADAKYSLLLAAPVAQPSWRDASYPASPAPPRRSSVPTPAPAPRPTPHAPYRMEQRTRPIP